MNFRNISISKIVPYERNAKKHDERQIANVAESIRQYGFVQPVVIDKNGVIVIGHCRVLAAKKLGMSEVPCVCVDGLTPEQVNALRLVDNKTNESPWDMSLLREELNLLDLDGFDFDWNIPGLEDMQIEEDEAPEVDETKPPVSRPGDIWRLGRHRLMCGDSTSAESVQKFLGGVQADLLLTDPPYGVDYVGKTKDALKIENDAKTDDELIHFLQSAFEAADSVMKPGAVFYIWHADSKAHVFRMACQMAGWEVRQVLIWVKNAMVMGRQDYQWKHEPCLYGWKGGAGHLWASDRKQTTVLEFDRPTRNKEHPTMKPVALFDYQIKNNTKGGDIVLDLFAGSGTTVIACEQDGHLADNQSDGIRCGDNGIFRGMPVTAEQSKLSGIARDIFFMYPSDGKYILDGERLIICQSNAPSNTLKGLFPNAEVNPLGDWTGGTNVDTGAANRKLGSDMADSVTGGGLHGKDLSKADVSVNIYAFLKAQATDRPVELCCAIGDDIVDGRPYDEIVEIAREYIERVGGFEKFAEWGLV